MKMDQQFNAILNNYLKDFGQTPISKEQRAMLPIIAFTVQGIPEQIKVHVQAAIDQRINSEKILEIIYQLEPVVGVGKVQAALKVAHQIIPANHNAKMIRNSAKMFKREFTERKSAISLLIFPMEQVTLSLIT